MFDRWCQGGEESSVGEGALLLSDGAGRGSGSDAEEGLGDEAVSIFVTCKY